MIKDWKSLTFSYTQVPYAAICHWKDGQWSKLSLQESPYIQLHMAASALHYGQSVFEGLKAFRDPDENIKVFRPKENAKRLQLSARKVMIPEVPEELFIEAVFKTVEANKEYIPPHATKGSLYIRPFVFGSGPTIGVRPSDEYTFIVLVTPVGDYYKNGISPIPAIVYDQFDRAAPFGTGSAKLAGNYAASLESSVKAKSEGFPVVLFLDAKTHSFVEEFSTSNFIGVTKQGHYVTPKSNSILASIINKSLMQLASDLGHEVEHRPIPFTELKQFTEVGACGTAVVLTPIESITRADECIKLPVYDEFGPILGSLYKKLTNIQFGREEDPHGWLSSLT